MVAAALVALGYTFWPRAEASVAGFVKATGVVEGETYVVASPLPGRLEVVLAREGDRVEAGDEVARLRAETLTAVRDQAAAQVRLAVDQQAQLRASIAAARHQALQAEMSEQQALIEADLAVAQAESGLRQAESQRDLARREAERAQLAYGAKLIGESELDKAKTVEAVALAQFELAQAALEAASKARSLLDQPTHAKLAAEALVSQAVAALSLAESQEFAARAGLAQAEAALADAVVRAPISGTVVSRLANDGEVLGPGAPILSIVDLRRLRVAVYVPENEMSLIQVGGAARLTVDGMARAFEARVSRIANQAQFTPRNVQTKSERTRLVYRVELTVDNMDGALKPGVPADVWIRVDAAAAWPVGN